MSLTEAMAAAEREGRISLRAIKDLEASCCDRVEQEVYDFDAYKDSLREQQPSKSCDGVYVVERPDKDRILLLEMKGLANCRIEFEHVGNEDQSFEDFLQEKFADFDLKDKFSQSNILLCHFQEGLVEAIEADEIGETAVLLCNFSYRDFLSYRDAIRAVMREISSPHWGTPRVANCEMFTDRDYFNSLLT